MKTGWSGVLAVFALALGPFTPLAAGASPANRLEDFNPGEAPARPDWRHFVRAPEAERERLWVYQAKRGKQLKDWSWGWRLGWVRVCGKSPRPFCSQVLRQALFDRALVVRAEAATRIGRLYEGSRSDAAINLLAKAYRNSRNMRHGKPLFVQSRILFAIHQIGGPRAETVGPALAAEHPGVLAYWRKLEHADVPE